MRARSYRERETCVLVFRAHKQQPRQSMRNRPYACALLALVSAGPGASAWADDAPPPADTSAEPAGLKRVVVTAERVPQQDYRAPTVDSLGPLGTTPVLDTPYSVGILTHDMIAHSQAIDFKDVSKYLPLVAYQEQQGPDILRPQTRAVEGGTFKISASTACTRSLSVW